MGGLKHSFKFMFPNSDTHMDTKNLKFNRRADPAASNVR